MKVASRTLISCAVMFAALSTTSIAMAMDDHTVLTPNEVKWGPAPASIPKGAEAAVLFGDPSKEGPFALRLKFSKGYHIPPHSHPKPEIVTVLSGTVLLGEGDAADKSKTKALPAGSFFAMSPGMKHYVYSDDEAVLQLNTSGPWGLTYANEKDDPRKTQ
jgi:quercetin dioxygenase-like cupin family protein